MPYLAMLLLALSHPQLAAGQTSADSFVAADSTWRQTRLAGLIAAEGFLTLAGLYWLEEGTNRFGSDPANELVFPAGTPAHMGVFTLAQGVVSLAVAPEVEIYHTNAEGDSVGVAQMDFAELDQSDPSPLALGALRFYPIERQGRYGLRLKDLDSSTLRDFAGLDYFPAQQHWRLTGRFEPATEPDTIAVPTIIGTTAPTPSPGTVHFAVDGREHQLAVFGKADAASLWTIFADQTNGLETYGAGRFLVVENKGDGHYAVDFNRAYNPPCAFTPFATCPLPPPENHLDLRVEAGEKSYGEH